jgi:hypothetical protein
MGFEEFMIAMETSCFMGCVTCSVYLAPGARPGSVRPWQGAACCLLPFSSDFAGDMFVKRVEARLLLLEFDS